MDSDSKATELERRETPGPSTAADTPQKTEGSSGVRFLNLGASLLGTLVALVTIFEFAGEHLPRLWPESERRTEVIDERPAEPGARLPSQSLMLEEGAPVRFGRSGVTLEATFGRDDLGDVATLRISPPGQPRRVKTVFGPDAEISFRSNSGKHLLRVVAWDPGHGILEFSVSPPLE